MNFADSLAFNHGTLIISEILLDMFKGLKMAYPEPTAKRRQES